MSGHSRAQYTTPGNGDYTEDSSDEYSNCSVRSKNSAQKSSLSQWYNKILISRANRLEGEKVKLEKDLAYSRQNLEQNRVTIIKANTKISHLIADNDKLNLSLKATEESLRLSANLLREKCDKLQCEKDRLLIELDDADIQIRALKINLKEKETETDKIITKQKEEDVKLKEAQKAQEDKFEKACGLARQLRAECHKLQDEKDQIQKELNASKILVNGLETCQQKLSELNSENEEKISDLEHKLNESLRLTMLDVHKRIAENERLNERICQMEEKFCQIKKCSKKVQTEVETPPNSIPNGFVFAPVFAKNVFFSNMYPQSNAPVVRVPDNKKNAMPTTELRVIPLNEETNLQGRAMMFCRLSSISHLVTEKNIREFLKEYKIFSVFMQDGRRKTTAYIEFSTIKDSENARLAKNGSKIEQQIVTISSVSPKELHVLIKSLKNSNPTII